jgi:single-strand DNA-binding protein
MDLNKAMIIGNLTRDPEVRQTPTGQKVATFSLATNRYWTDASGTKQSAVEYHNCVVWRKLADVAEQYMKKGKKVYVEGRLQTRDWQGQDGVKRTKTEIVVEQLILLDGARGGTFGGQTGGGYAAQPSTPAPDYSNEPTVEPIMEYPAPSANQNNEQEVKVEDIPF